MNIIIIGILAALGCLLPSCNREAVTQTDAPVPTHVPYPDVPGPGCCAESTLATNPPLGGLPPGWTGPEQVTP